MCEIVKDINNVREVRDGLEFFSEPSVPSSVSTIKCRVPDRAQRALSNSIFKYYVRVETNKRI